MRRHRWTKSRWFLYLAIGVAASSLAIATSANARREAQVAHVRATFPDLMGERGSVTYDVWYDSFTRTAYTRLRNRTTGSLSESWIGPSGWYTRSRGHVRRVAKSANAARSSQFGAVATFLGHYKQALREGRAHRAGRTTFRGRPALAIDFPYDETKNPVTRKKERTSTRVLLDPKTLKPLATALVADGKALSFESPKTNETLATYFTIKLARLEARRASMFDSPNL